MNPDTTNPPTNPETLDPKPYASHTCGRDKAHHACVESRISKHVKSSTVLVLAIILANISR